MYKVSQNSNSWCIIRVSRATDTATPGPLSFPRRRLRETVVAAHSSRNAPRSRVQYRLGKRTEDSRPPLSRQQPRSLTSSPSSQCTTSNASSLAGIRLSRYPRPLRACTDAARACDSCRFLCIGRRTPGSGPERNSTSPPRQASDCFTQTLPRPATGPILFTEIFLAKIFQGLSFCGVPLLRELDQRLA